MGSMAELVKLLLAKGASPNAPDQVTQLYTNCAFLCHSQQAYNCIIVLFQSGKTALQKVCGSGNLEIMKLLLEAGANPNYKDSVRHLRSYALRYIIRAGARARVRLIVRQRCSPSIVPVTTLCLSSTLLL